jgi:hypothetical protein
MIKTLSEREPVSKFVCSSGGNAGHAVAVACESFKIPCDVYVPTTTLPMMIEKLKQRGANVVVSGENWNAADALARQALASDSSARYIPPYGKGVSGLFFSSFHLLLFLFFLKRVQTNAMRLHSDCDVNAIRLLCDLLCDCDGIAM